VVDVQLDGAPVLGSPARVVVPSGPAPFVSPRLLASRVELVPDALPEVKPVTLLNATVTRVAGKACYLTTSRLLTAASSEPVRVPPSTLSAHLEHAGAALVPDDLRLEQAGPGGITVSFTPSTPGAYKATLLLNEQQLLVCTFTVLSEQEALARRKQT